MKHLYLVTAILFSLMVFGGCSEKTPKVAEQKVEVVEVAKVQETKDVVAKNVIPKNETLVPEKKVTKNVDVDVPSSCAMWSDGCNVCTRTGGGKASCTTNPECTHKMFSCLQWQ
jgi:hypothetical protein